MRPGEKFRHPNGKIYEAVKNKNCNGCAFKPLSWGCKEAEFCDEFSNDGVPLIFIRVKTNLKNKKK